MKGFFALTFVTFWLTVFPLKGPLLQDPSLFLIFLIFHSLGFFLCYFKHSQLTEKRLVFASLIITAILIFIFPFVSINIKKLFTVIIGLISPPWILHALSFLKLEHDSLWPYTGLIFGNTLTLVVSFIDPTLYQKLFLPLGILMFSLLLIKSNECITKIPSDSKIILRRIDFILLYIAIFFFYLIGPILYDWLTLNDKPYFERNIHLNLIFYSLGILFTIACLKETRPSKKDIFVISASFLTIGNTLLHIKTPISFTIGKLFLFFSCGIMDILTLYIFINLFEDLKYLAFLMGLISLSLFTSNTFFYFFRIEDTYLFSYVSLISLLSLLCFYKLNLHIEKAEQISTEHDLISQSIENLTPVESEKATEKMITPEMLYTEINKNLESSSKKLSKRECEVIYYYVYEKKNLTEVAETLNISRSSAKEYLKRACLKLGTNQYELKNIIEELIKK